MKKSIVLLLFLVMNTAFSQTLVQSTEVQPALPVVVEPTYSEKLLNIQPNLVSYNSYWNYLDHGTFSEIQPYVDEVTTEYYGINGPPTPAVQTVTTTKTKVVKHHLPINSCGC